MINLSLRKKDIIKLAIIATIASIIPYAAEIRQIELKLYPFACLIILAASIFMEAYFRAQRELRIFESEIYEKSAPLAALRDQIARRITGARLELDRLRSETETIKIINSLAQLDRENTIALRKSLFNPSRSEIFKERVLGFITGVLSGILSSYLFKILQTYI